MFLFTVSSSDRRQILRHTCFNFFCSSCKSWFSFLSRITENRFFLKSYLINDLFRYNYGHKNIKFISLPQLFNGYKKWWTRDSFCTHIWNVEIILTHRAARDEVQQILPMSGLIQSLNRNRWWTERRHYSEATLGRALSF